MKLIHAVIIMFLSAANLTYAQNTEIGRIGIMPFVSESIDRITLNSAEAILRLELSKLSEMEIVTAKSLTEEIKDSNCHSSECIEKFGEKLNAEQVVTCNFLVLGQKIIIEYSVYSIAEKKIIISDSIISMSIEELDIIMKRIAMSIIRNESAKLTAEKGVITEEESQKPLLRGGGTFYGLSLGYLFPLTGFGDSERSFTIDLKIGAELENFDYGIQLFGRQGFGVNIYSSYLLTKDDFCPYIGAGIGFHWLTNLQNNYYYMVGDMYEFNQDNGREDGIELQLNSGLRIFNTYKMKITINLTFAHTFNDYNSDSFIFTIGFLR